MMALVELPIDLAAPGLMVDRPAPELPPARRARDCRAVVGRDRHVDADDAVARAHVELPADADDRKSLLHQEAVADEIDARRAIQTESVVSPRLTTSTSATPSPRPSWATPQGGRR